MNTIHSHLNKDNFILGAKIVGGALLAAGTATTVGYGLNLAGTRLISYATYGTNHSPITVLALKFFGNTIHNVGSILSVGGKAVAYSILVPAYTIGYVAPKWIITQGIPMGLKFGRDFVIIPILHGITTISQYASTKIYQLAESINNYILQPFFKGFGTAANFAARGILKGLEFGRDYIVMPLMNSFKTAFLYVSTKIGQLAALINDYILQPFLKELCKITKFAAENVVKACKLTLDYIVLPVIKGIGKVLRYASVKVSEIALLIHHHILKPILTTLTKATKLLEDSLVTAYKVGRDYIILPVINGVLSATHYVGTQIGKAATLINDLIIKPIFKGIADCAARACAFTYNRLVVPVLNATISIAHYAAIKTCQAANLINGYVIQPIFQGVVDCSLKLYGVVRNYIVLPVVNGTVFVAHYSYRVICQTAGKVNAYVIMPILKAVAKAFVFASGVAGEVAQTITYTASQVPNVVNNIYCVVSKDIAAVFHKIFG